MNRFAMLAVFTLLLTAGPALQAQSCYTPITSWQGSYTLTGSGGGEDVLGLYSWTIDHEATGVPNLAFAGVTCSSATWAGPDSSATGSANDVGTATCGDGSPDTESFTGGPTFLTEGGLILNLASKTFQYIEDPIITATITTDSCGTVNTSSGPFQLAPFDAGCGGTLSLPTIALPGTVGELSGEVSIPGVATCPYAIPGSWSLTYDLTPSYSEDCDCKKKGGSTIGSQNQSLGEDIPIAGTDFSLHYEGSRVASAGGNPVASKDASMIGGWTLSVHHAYDPGTGTLFLGNGEQRNAYQLGTPVNFGGNTLITSEDGSEIYVFNSSNGQHLQTQRPMTGAIEYKFSYGTAGNLTKVTDAEGNVTKILRNSSGHPTGVVSPFGQTTALSVDANGFLNQATDPLGKTSTFTNDSTGLLIARTDANGNTYNYTYDANGRLIKDADPVGGFLGLARSNAASGLGSSVAQTTAMGVTSNIQNQLQVPWVQDGTTPFSEQRTITWPDGLPVTVNKTQQNNQLTETVAFPDGTSYSETSGPDPVWGMQVPVTTATTLTAGSVTMNITGGRSTTLGTAGNPFTVSSETDTKTVNGRNYTTVFTGTTRTYVNTTPVGRTLTIALDSLERVASRQIGGLTATKFAYDSRGRLASQTQGARKTTFTYGADGFLASATDPLGQTTSFVHDADGRVTTVTLPDARAIDYAYDANGNLTSITPPGKSAHDFTYTAVDLPASYTPPTVLGAGATNYEYDLDRNLTTVTRPDGSSVNFGYDSASRLVSVATPTGTTTFTYDVATGNLVSTKRGSERISYSYNGPLPTKSTWKGTVAGGVTRSYNDNFWVASQGVVSGTNVAMKYDNDGLMTKAGSFTITRSPTSGLIKGTTLGVATDSRIYNDFGELVGYTASVSGSPVYKAQYTRDADGRVTAKTETIGAANNTDDYSYDPAGRLITATRNTTTDSYTYDTNSNRLTASTSAGTTHGSYDAQDRLLAYGSTSFTYTANGELSSQKTGSKKVSYTYDVLGNLISATLSNGTKISYIIDPENHRVGKTVSGVLTTGFLYDDDRIVAQLNGSNQVVSQFVYATGSTSPDYMISGGVTYRIFSDRLGSPLLVVNSSTGAIAEQLAFDEFGNVLSDTNPGFQPFGFAGGLYDQDTGLLRFGARDYNPKVGRWTAKDPILFDAGDTNLYGYVLNDPVNWLDPSGLQEKCEVCEIQAKKALEKTAKMWIKSKGGTDSDAIEKGIQKEVGNRSPLQEWKNANERSQKTAEDSATSLVDKLKQVWNTCSKALLGD